MGLGKTATTLAHLMDRPGPHLVVCPLSVVHNWEAEAARFAPEMRVLVHHGAERIGAGGGDRETGDVLDGIVPEPVGPDKQLAEADLVITTYGLLPRDIEHLGAVAWSTVVADEAQLIKNPGTRAAKAFRVAAGRAEAGPHRHAGGEPPGRPVGHPRRRQPGDAGQSGAVPAPVRQADRAGRRRRGGGPPAAHHPAVRAATHQGRPHARARPPRQDRADRLGRAHP